MLTDPKTLESFRQIYDHIGNDAYLSKWEGYFLAHSKDHDSDAFRLDFKMSEINCTQSNDCKSSQTSQTNGSAEQSPPIITSLLFKQLVNLSFVTYPAMMQESIDGRPYTSWPEVLPATGEPIPNADNFLLWLNHEDELYQAVIGNTVRTVFGKAIDQSSSAGEAYDLTDLLKAKYVMVLDLLLPTREPAIGFIVAANELISATYIDQPGNPKLAVKACRHWLHTVKISY